MWIGVLWAGLRAAMWITHVGGKFRHGLLEKSLNYSNYSGINLDITLHSLYHNYSSAEILLLYIILTATLELHLFLGFHYIKIPEAN